VLNEIKKSTECTKKKTLYLICQNKNKKLKLFKLNNEHIFYCILLRILIHTDIHTYNNKFKQTF